MNLETRMGQSLGVNQQLNLAPQLLQWLRLLQLPTNELHSVVQQELEINPSLEIDERWDEPEAPVERLEAGDPEPTSFEDNDLNEKFEILAEMDRDWGADEYAATSYNPERDEKRQFMLSSITGELSLQEYLLGQLRNRREAAGLFAVAEMVIGSLDQRGYLVSPLDEIMQMAGCDRAAAEAALKLVQSFDPPGLGGRDLRECLLLQLDQDEELAARVVTDYLEALGRGQYREIALELDVTENEIVEVLRRIRTLNPEPGRGFTPERTHYIKPDVTIYKTDDGYCIELNDSCLPRLKVSDSCREMLASGSLKRPDAGYLRRKIRASSFLIQGIRQRQETLQKVAEAILRHQRDYFDHPEGSLTPLTMARVAAEINVHETTVSRAVANKYVQTPRGLFEMRHFFRSGYQCADGTAVIPTAVKDLITQLVDNEPPVRPLTDLEIAAKVSEQGIKLARRTVAKYREELGIASSKDRQTHRRRPAMRLAEPAAVEPAAEESPRAVMFA